MKEDESFTGLDMQITRTAERRVTWESAKAYVGDLAGQAFLMGKDELANHLRSVVREFERRRVEAADEQHKLLAERDK